MSLKKIDRPPYVHNWARYNFPDELKTTKAIVQFIENAPRITYAAGSAIIRDRITLKLDRETALTAALTKGHEKSRPFVREFVEAFYDHDEARQYSGLPAYDQFVEPFRASKSIKIPVKPLIVIAEDGMLKPIFVVGWATMPLNKFQRRLLMTIIEDAVFSLTDFQKSKGEFVSFPRAEGTNSGERTPEVWERGDFDLLNKAELKDQIDLYLRALTAAKEIVLGKSFPKTQEVSDKKQVDPRQTEFEV
jgi:hypothetical protein